MENQTQSAQPIASHALFGVWINAAETPPKEADGDGYGDVWAWMPEHAHLGPQVVKTDGIIGATHWMRIDPSKPLDSQFPSPPNVERMHPLPAWAEGYYRVGVHTTIKRRKHSGW